MDEQTLRELMPETLRALTALAKEIMDQKEINAALVEALEVIKTALGDGEGGSFWPARKFLDDRNIYHGDLNDLRVLDRVARAALALARGEK